MKRKHAEDKEDDKVRSAASPHGVVAAALSGYAEKLAAELRLLPPPPAVLAPVAGCSPLLAAIIGGSPDCVSMLCKLVRCQFARAAAPHCCPARRHRRQLRPPPSAAPLQCGGVNKAFESDLDVRALRAHFPDLWPQSVVSHVPISDVGQCQVGANVWRVLRRELA